MNDNSSYWDIIITTVTAATTTATATATATVLPPAAAAAAAAATTTTTTLLLLLLLLLLLVGQEDEGIWEQGLMISMVLLEMTEPVSHKRYQKYIFLSVAQIYLATPTRNQFHTRKITSIESNG